MTPHAPHSSGSTKFTSQANSGLAQKDCLCAKTSLEIHLCKTSLEIHLPIGSGSYHTGLVSSQKSCY